MFELLALYIGCRYLSYWCENEIDFAKRKNSIGSVTFQLTRANVTEISLLSFIVFEVIRFI